MLKQILNHNELTSLTVINDVIVFDPSEVKEERVRELIDIQGIQILKAVFDSKRELMFFQVTLLVEIETTKATQRTIETVAEAIGIEVTPLYRNKRKAYKLPHLPFPMTGKEALKQMGILCPVTIHLNNYHNNIKKKL